MVSVNNAITMCVSIGLVLGAVSGAYILGREAGEKKAQAEARPKINIKWRSEASSLVDSVFNKEETDEKKITGDCDCSNYDFDSINRLFKRNSNG